MEWRAKRNASIKTVEFPFEYRDGQKKLVASVYRTILRKKKLFIQAPTGVGKTMAAVFPAVKAVGEVTGMTVTQVMGCGVQKGAPTYYRGVEVDMNLRPKVKIEIVVSLVPVQKVIDTAKEVLHTGQIGDGKVFVYDIENVVKIRTGEEGFLALQDTDA